MAGGQISHREVLIPESCEAEEKGDDEVLKNMF